MRVVGREEATTREHSAISARLIHVLYIDYLTTHGAALCMPLCTKD